MSKKNKDLVRKIILIISLPVFFISLISVYTGVREYYKNNKLYNNLDNLNPFNNTDLSIAYTKLKELNEDYVGWLYIPGTKVNYPLVKGTDNSFYLNHNFFKEESKAGSIFIDCNINEFEDKNTIIYGHYMKDGSMFADLHKIYSELDNTLKIYIATETKIDEYEIFSIFKDSADINNYQTFWSTGADYIHYLNTLIDKSTINNNIPLDKESEILTLSTCDFNYLNGRLLLIAMLVY
ncbi:MAG: class B sortase [Clostridium sp.]